MRSFAAACLDAATAAGASYADVRVVDTLTQSLSVRTGRVESVTTAESFGFGVRVIANGAWGFAASAAVDSPGEAERVARQAVAIARASGLVRAPAVRLAAQVPERGSWAGPCEVDPFSIPIDDKLGLLLEADTVMRGEAAVTVTSAHMEFAHVTKVFASTDGSLVEQEHWESGAGIVAYALGDDEVLPRSYPNSHGGQWVQGGWETIVGLELTEHAARLASEAAALLTARRCPAVETTVIIDGSQLGLQVHESIGHPTELDRVLGDEAAYAGTSFLGTGDLGLLRYASDIVNVTADSTVPGSLGSFGWDDEGVPAQRDFLVRDGFLDGFLMSRESAAAIGQSSNGCARADGWNRIPLVRMTTVSLEPGDAGTLGDLIADTEEGVYLETNNSWSIDDKRLNFQFGCEVGWEIRNGELGAMIKSPNYTGVTPRFWASCDAVCSASEWTVWGLPNCGKGEPMQVAHVAHGAAPARFRNVRIGVGR